MIDEAMVKDLVASIDGRPLDVPLLDALKQRFKGIPLTACFEDDVLTGKPVYRTGAFSIYLVGGGDHCLTLTNDYDIATGVVIAEVVE